MIDFIYVECLMVIITSFLGYRSISLVLSFLLCAKLVTWMIVRTIRWKEVLNYYKGKIKY